MANKVDLISAAQLIDRGTWVRLKNNPEEFTRENMLKQLNDNPLDYLEQLTAFKELKEKCNLADITESIEIWQKEFIKNVFDGKKERFWSYVADDYLQKYFNRLGGEINYSLKEKHPF